MGDVQLINPLNPHGALKHLFTSLKIDLIIGFRTKWTKLFNNNYIFFHLPPTSSHFHLLQVVNCDRNSRLVVDEDDNGKFRLERVK